MSIYVTLESIAPNASQLPKRERRRIADRYRGALWQYLFFPVTMLGFEIGRYVSKVCETLGFHHWATKYLLGLTPVVVIGYFLCGQIALRRYRTQILEEVQRSLGSSVMGKDLPPGTMRTG